MSETRLLVSQTQSELSFFRGSKFENLRVRKTTYSTGQILKIQDLEKIKVSAGQIFKIQDSTGQIEKF